MENKITEFQAWNSDYPGHQHGSFVTHLFRAYQHADFHNKKKLETAFPQYFIEETVVALSQENH